MEVDVRKNPMCFSRWSVRKEEVKIMTLTTNYQCEGQMTIFDYLNLETKNDEISIDEMIKEAVIHGTGFAGGKQRVCELYQKDISATERAKKIKEEYGQGGAGWPLEGFGLHGYNTFAQNGLTLNWRDKSGEHDTLITWNKIEKVIHKLINDGEYCKKPIPYHSKTNSRKFAKCPRCGERLPEFSKPPICEECHQELDWINWGVNYLTSEIGGKSCDMCKYADYSNNKCLCKLDCINYSKFEENQ